jgi:hypothetical protein
LRDHLTRLSAWFENTRRDNAPGVSLPQALVGKYRGASTMIYTHVMAKGAKGVRSPLDLLR